MEFCLYAVIGILALLLLLSAIKIHLLQKSADEINAAFAHRLSCDTNILIDISTRDVHMRRLAESINVQLRLLRKERLHFQQGDLALKEAVTNISHDLRTPLTAVCGYLELMEQEEMPDNASRYLEIIKSRTEVLKQLTEELFHYSVFTSVAGNTESETVDLNRALEDSISACYTTLINRCIVPDIHMPEAKTERVLNKNALSRVLENILTNAAKYSDGDLHISLSEDGTFLFSNRASGLDEVQVQKLFDRFYTVNNAENSTGLGLSIARTLTEQMGGTISAGYADGRISIYLHFPPI